MPHFSQYFSQMYSFMSGFEGGSRLQDLQPSTWLPAVDIYECAEELVVLVELPGIDRERLSVSVNQGVLRIHGFRPNRVPDGARHVHQMEIPHGPFARFVTLPACTDVAHIEAEYEQGYLTVRIPRGRRHE